MIKRVAYKLGKGFCKLLKFCVFVSISCYVLLGNTRCTHLAPLIMVTAEEEVKCISELIIFCNLLRLKVAMIVDNGKILYHCIELLCRLIFEHKAIVNKTHKVTPSLKMEISL